MYEANFAKLRKTAAQWSNEMKAWNGEVNWYCPKEQSLKVNDIRRLIALKVSRHLILQLRKNPENLQLGKLAGSGV